MTIEEICNKFHWASIANDGVLEVCLDHHTMSTYRMCEAKFDLEFMQNIAGKGLIPWSLNFGTVFHKMIEYIYDSKSKGDFSFPVMLACADAAWVSAGLDMYEEHKTYKALGGKAGFIVLLAQYSEFYSNEHERLRPIGVELPFGKGKEVPLGEIFFSSGMKVRCYLAGRIDFLMDSGSAIGPMDHKTKAFFKGNPALDHDPQEGMTGYVYASNHIIHKNFPELAAKRKVDRIWMNYIQVKSESDFNKRFKRIPIFKTEYQLEQFRLRQLSTITKILDFILSGRVADWNTSVCANSFYQDCPYKGLHSTNSASSMLTILNHDFYKAPAWNPADMEERDNAQKASVLTNSQFNIIKE